MGRLWRIRYVSPDGVEWPLMSETHRGVFLAEGGLGSVWGKRAENPIQVVGRDGQRRAHVGRLQGLSTSLEVVVTEGAGRSVGEVWAEWLRSWPLGQPGTLIVSSDTGLGELSTPVRLSDDAGVSSFPYQPDEIGYFTVSMPVVMDAGCWFFAASGVGTVEITNSGDAVCVPRLVWSGSGGVVVAPSGATFVLPPVVEERVLTVDPAESYLVTDTAGVVDGDLWRRVRGGVRGGPVPPGGTAVWQLPTGARLEWRIGVVNPWL